MIMDYEFKVVSGQLVLLPKALSDQLKQDILNTQLYAQLYASVSANKFSDPMVWDKRVNHFNSDRALVNRLSQTIGSENLLAETLAYNCAYN